MATLKCSYPSAAKKTAGCAVTYRAGGESKYDTCPSDCPLNASGCGTAQVDTDYLESLSRAVPRQGVSFTYSHFPPEHWAHLNGPRRTVINWSAPRPAAAARCVADRVAPAVTVVPRDYWQGRKHVDIDGVRVVRCLAEYVDGINCSNCGGRSGPLCARPNARYAVGFTAHGSGAGKAESDAQGGCYADTGHAGIQWARTGTAAASTVNTGAGCVPCESETDALKQFVEQLPRRTVLRHHVAGDLGKSTP